MNRTVRPARSKKASAVARNRSGRWGFTLVELLVSVTIIGFLIALLIPGLNKARRAAASSVCQSNLKQIGNAFTMYLGENEEMYPVDCDPYVVIQTLPVTGNDGEPVLEDVPFRAGCYPPHPVPDVDASDDQQGSSAVWLWMGRGFREPIGKILVPDLTKENPSVLVCPDDETDPDKFERTSYAYSMAFYHAPVQIDQMLFTDQWGTESRFPPWPMRSSMVIHPGRKILSGEWEAYHDRLRNDGGWWDSQVRGRRNYLFADSHVERVGASRIVSRKVHKELKGEEADEFDEHPNPNLTVNGIDGFDVR